MKLTSVNGSRLVAAKNIFSDNPPLQISISTFNLINVAFVVFISSKISRNDMSRLYVLWLYSMTAPADCVQIVISMLQIFRLVDSTGHYYRDYCDIIQMIGKIFNDIAVNVYKILCLLMLVATFMSYTFPFTSQRLFHTKKRSRLYLGGVIFVVLNMLYNNIQTMVTVAYELDPTLVDVWYLSIHVIGSTCTFLLILFYILSIIVILLYANGANRMTNAGKKHRRQLVSVIVYATMPNIIVVLQQVMQGVMLAMAATPIEIRTLDNPLVVTGAITTQAYRYATYARVPILTISTFVAFTAYRRALMLAIPFRISITHIQPAVSNVTTQTMSTTNPYKANRRR
ncbi:hypothetical protein QR680_006461 [Steinernema hermaphroditum]|uniref:Uncharacterized protein n=1 Tax=Steinernema hermaphroditum TaxID=289476 RepID=A0AA39LXG1_9BILA|nr:hypothetical protein QR680_006461 [Steinernema hermaphroditum]